MFRSPLRPWSLRYTRRFLVAHGAHVVLMTILLSMAMLLSSCQDNPSELPSTAQASTSSEVSVTSPSGSIASSEASQPSVPMSSSTSLPPSSTEEQTSLPPSSTTSEECSSSQPSLPEPMLEVPPPLLGDTADLSADPFFDEAFFIGDSITTGLDMLVDFDERPRLARIGLTLQSADTEIRDYAGLSPSYVFVLLGTNDLNYYNMNEELYAERYGTLIQTLQEQFPKALIYPQTILPVAHFYEGSESITNERIASFNAALKALCAERNVDLIDIGAAWRLPDLSLHPDVTSDGLHINYQYYGSWLQLLKNAVQGEE